MENKRELIRDIRTVLDFYNNLPPKEIYYNPRYEGDDEKNLYLRLERAAIDQAHGERATSGRYAIWSRDIRFLIKTALEDINNKETDLAEEKLISALNSIGAFEDVMVIFDDIVFPEHTDKPWIFDGYRKYKDKK